ncbi:ActR/PrrA/RegA family redox response regulator transcription factor [Radicibacter daui]|uniref:ActR/PrrA/RegA family redox response regulator transcription factor n=1 Tax=Radicibacter daui TaxID=3064829 RepID=UPI00404703D6
MTSDLESNAAAMPMRFVGESDTLLVVDDDAPFRNRLARALEKRGFEVVAVGSLAEARSVLKETAPVFAAVDMRLEDGNGLDLVADLRTARPEVRVVMLTGYGNIASAVAAIKSGAIDYLPKPTDADQVEAALRGGESAPLPPPPEEPMSADRVRWEHIQRVFEQCNRNVSETARRLKMHRRTLQRILGKHAPRT